MIRAPSGGIAANCCCAVKKSHFLLWLYAALYRCHLVASHPHLYTSTSAWTVCANLMATKVFDTMARSHNKLFQGSADPQNAQIKQLNTVMRSIRMV